ncbi:MAG: group III truncated hemoglobin [Alphaproteobacteria bacterium]|nr:group III truncated hemoglobin [Alphaproteobacteria bacterium]
MVSPPFEAIASDREIGALVHDFYGRARADATLGPIFEKHVKDWDRHFLLLADFWSSVLNTSGRYKGQPMIAHMRLPELEEHHFAHWLSMFETSAEATLNPKAAAVAKFKAARIAQSMRLGLRQLLGKSILEPLD